MTSARYGQLGFKSETAWGTAVTVDTFHEGYLSGNPVRTQPPLISQGINGRRTANTAQPGAKTVQGSFAFELLPDPLATLLHHAFGTVSTAGTAAPYTHTFSPGDTDALEGMTIQVGIPDDAGTVRPFTYSGSRVTDWTITGQAGEIATFDLSVVSKDYVTGTSLASASYGTFNPFTFIDGQVVIAGGTVATVSQFTLSGTIPRRIEHRIGGSLIMEPVEAGRNEYTIEVTPKFEDLTLHDLANTEVAVVLSFSNGSESLTVTTNAFVDPTTPEMVGVDSEVSDSFRAMCMGTTDATAITAVLVNDEASAA